MARIFVFLLSMMLLGLPLTTQASPVTLQALEDLVATALEQNPELKADEARWQAFMYRARQAGTLEDPMLMLGVQSVLIRDPLAFNRDSMTAKVIGVSQSLPFYGKRELERRAAELDAEAGRWAYEERKIELERMVRESWYQLYAVDRSIEVVEHNILLVEDLIALTETLYGVGSALQQDVLRAQLERSKMEDMRISLRQQRRSLEARINTLVYRPADVAVPTISELSLTTVNPDGAHLEKLAEEQRPLFRALQASREKADVSRNRAVRENYPDFTLSFEYMQREPAMGEEGYDMYSAGVSFNLPMQRQRRQAMVAEADSEKRMAEADIHMLRNEIRLGIADGLARLERNRRMVELYRDGIIPQAAGTVDASLAAYQVGQAEFMNVLDSQMALFNYQREFHEAIAEHEMVRIQLEALVGARLQ
jgi:outer membrane protein, heavy metal efflux system